MLNTSEIAFPHETIVRRGHATVQFRQVLDRPTFHRVLDHERARSDRSGQPFAVVVFSPREAASDQGNSLQTAQSLLMDRMSTIDEIGWFADRRLGIVLPYSSAESAWNVADEVTSAFPISVTLPACEVYAYPTNWPSPESDDEDDLPRRRVRQLEPHFARPLPWWKRMMDVVGAVVGLCLLSPLFLLVALAIKLTSRGPAFFTQWRSGLGGRRFRMVKFRTMVVDAEQRRHELLKHNEQDGPAFKVTNDPRVTRLGRFLRITSIDEFPQLWNVLKGDMSLVGPRPLPCHEAEACEVWQRRRLDVTPGLTCIWQTRGRPRTSFALWMRLDLEYIRVQSFWTDVKLILLTIPTVLKNRADR
jgi:lipopolysaccharide/colanic/teichoic acid biosynthesis glycosyltransferase